MTRTNSERLATVETEVKNVRGDITEIKSDIKEIKLALESNFVTQVEFQNYKSGQTTQKILLSLINLIFGALLGIAISALFRG